MAKWYSYLPKLTPELLRMLIQKILIHESSVKDSKTAKQQIEIHYAHIGLVEDMGNATKVGETD